MPPVVKFNRRIHREEFPSDIRMRPNRSVASEGFSRALREPVEISLTPTAPQMSRFKTNFKEVSPDLFHSRFSENRPSNGIGPVGPMMVGMTFMGLIEFFSRRKKSRQNLLQEKTGSTKELELKRPRDLVQEKTAKDLDPDQQYIRANLKKKVGLGASAIGAISVLQFFIGPPYLLAFLLETSLVYFGGRYILRKSRERREIKQEAEFYTETPIPLLEGPYRPAVALTSRAGTEIKLSPAKQKEMELDRFYFETGSNPQLSRKYIESLKELPINHPEFLKALKTINDLLKKSRPKYLLFGRIFSNDPERFFRTSAWERRWYRSRVLNVIQMVYRDRLTDSLSPTFVQRTKELMKTLRHPELLAHARTDLDFHELLWQTFHVLEGFLGDSPETFRTRKALQQ